MSHRVCQGGRERGFTIVELMVVVSIIFALMALLLPALSSAREFGRRAMCLSNMHQLALAMNMYADQSNGRFPPYLYQVEENISGNGNTDYQLVIKIDWSMADIGPLRNPNILLCPSDKNPVVINTTDPSGKPITFKTSYGYNFDMLLEGVGVEHVAGDRTALLFDGEPDQATTGTWYGNPAATGSADAGGGVVVATAENAGVLATDGDGGGGGGGAGGCNGYPNCVADANGKTWVCHIPQGDGNQAGMTMNYVNLTATGPQGHQNHTGDCCGSCDPYRYNAQLLDRRHFSKANVIFVDGHGEWLFDLPSGSIVP